MFTTDGSLLNIGLDTKYMMSSTFHSTTGISELSTSQPFDSLFWNRSLDVLGNATVVKELEAIKHRHVQFSPSTSVFLAVLMIVLVFATIVGNALVILAFVVEKSLRTHGNFFFLNLAIADLLVGGFCIPVYIPYVLTGEWRLGRGLCKLWLVVDYMVCTASVFNIVLISFDRFLSVTKAVSYRCQKGVTSAAVLKMVSVWLAAFLLYGPAIISWEHIAGGSVVPTGECYAEFYFNWYFLMTASTVEFFTPFISVTYFNLSIYINIRKRTEVREQQPTKMEFGNCEMESLGASGVNRVFFVRPIQTHARSIKRKGARSRCGRLSNAKVSAAAIGDAGQGGRRESATLDLPPLQVGDLAQQCAPPRFHNAEQSFEPVRTRSDASANLASRSRLSRDKKVAKSLAVIVGVFGLCWAPYTLLMIIRAACHGQCVQHYMYETSFWLLWVNSSINPVLYPLCHSSFKRAFSKLLCPNKINIQPQYVEPNY